MHHQLISDFHINLCSSLNQLQDTSTNARFVQVSWSKRVASFFLRRTCYFMLITLNSLNSGVVLWKYCFINCVSKHQKIKLAPGYGCAGYTNGSVGFKIQERTFNLSYQISTPSVLKKCKSHFSRSQIISTLIEFI